MLEAIKICKSFPQSDRVLDQISISVKAGEFLTLLGPSGCGKTTFLRCIAGLENPDQGEILFEGQSILAFPPQQRPFHMVFQKYALFPHMTVSENIEFSLKNKKVEASQRQKRVKELLELMQLPDFANRMPASLSGGQSQRIALARAIADQPKLLLLDEPFSALDEKIRVQLRTELKSLQKKLGLTFVFVTHDQQEALQMSDRIALFNNGQIEQLGTPEQLFFSPQSIFTAEFLGQKNLIEKSGQQARYLSPEKIKCNSTGDVKLQGQIELASIAGPYYEFRIKDSAGQYWLTYWDHAIGNKIKVGDRVSFSYNHTDVIHVAGHPK